MQTDEVFEYQNITELFPVIDDYIHQVCIDDNFDESNITPSNWVYILEKIRYNIIDIYRYLLREDKTKNYNNSKYNKDDIFNLYSYFRTISNKYNKRISLKNFLYFTGINHCTIYDLNLGDILNNGYTEFSKTIQEDHEESLVNLMDNARNPVAYLSELNNRFGWNQPGIDRKQEDTMKATALTDARKQFELFGNPEQFSIESGNDDNI